MLQYEQRTGILSRDGAQLGTGYAGGDRGAFPAAINNPAYQFIHDQGPLPQGLYTLGAAETNPHLGSVAIPLTPDPSNDMGNPPRGGFFIHGDSVEFAGQKKASDGCIIMERPVRLGLQNGEQLTVVEGPGINPALA
jgi:hypothetical protein